MPHSAPLYQPGFRTLGHWSEDPPLRMDMNIWYPGRRGPQSLSYPPWTISGALNAKPAGGVFPLILISHATPATRFSHHDLGAYLARAGFIVAAPTHPRDNLNNMDDLFTWNQLANRARDISETIKILLADVDIGPHIDKGKIGVAGFEAGGAAALLLGGAKPDCSSWADYCGRAKRGDAYCSARAKKKINALCAAVPQDTNLANPLVRAIAAVCPAYGMLFGNDSFQHLSIPVLLVGAGRDLFNPPLLHSEALARLLGKKAKYLNLPEADASALSSSCPPALDQELPELCRSVPVETRESLLAALHEGLLSFFMDALHVDLSGNLPVEAE